MEVQIVGEVVVVVVVVVDDDDGDDVDQLKW